MMPGMIVLPLHVDARRAGRHLTDDDGPTAVMRLPSTMTVRVLDHARRALIGPASRPAIVITRAPTSASAPAGTSLFAVKPMLMPFASGSSGFGVHRCSTNVNVCGEIAREELRARASSDSVRLSPDQCR